MASFIKIEPWVFGSTLVTLGSSRIDEDKLVKALNEQVENIYKTKPGGAALIVSIPSLSLVVAARISLQFFQATEYLRDVKLYGKTPTKTLIYAWIGTSKDLVPDLLNGRFGVIVLLTDGTSVAYSQEHGGKKHLLCETAKPGMTTSDVVIKAIEEEFSSTLAETLDPSTFRVIGGGVMNRLNGFPMCDGYTAIQVRVPPGSFDGLSFDGSDIGEGMEIAKAGILGPTSDEWHPRFRPILELYNTEEGFPLQRKLLPTGALKEFWLVGSNSLK